MGTACSSAAPRSSIIGTGESAAPGKPSRIVAAISSEPVAVRYAMQAQVASQTPGVDALEELLSAGLGIVDNRGILRPQLSETVPTLANGGWAMQPDGRMVTMWTLRSDV